MEEADRLFVDRRVRNRIIAYLEFAASFDEQLAYDAAGSCAHVPNEVINQWEDLVPRAGPAALRPSVFSRAETRALLNVASIWEQLADALPVTLPPSSTCSVWPLGTR